MLLEITYTIYVVYLCKSYVLITRLTAKIIPCHVKIQYTQCTIYNIPNITIAIVE